MDRMAARMEQRSTDIPVDNETKSTSTRTTSDGRVITYQMNVLQQPQRARACGQGAKSSADRRPVDPPPIVELKIFQGEKQEEDITFQMHANYFLFATLESARSMAHGRVPQDRQTPPVLTGTPVAGMVYLDRPAPAGYFIFPDLSVRHEGRYRLSFSLYEELKNSKDDDKTDEAGQPNQAGDAHVTHRLEVKSEPFHVYSAKKFPGLSESTSLSRMVAEQGCRVRIRRDVRMRRRDPKSDGKDWDEYEDNTAEQRARASQTPDPNMYPVMQTPHGFMEPISRPRSASNASHHSLGTSVSRRPSLQEMGQAYHQPSSHYGTAPHTPQHGYAQASYGPSPAQQYQPAQFVSQAPMQPPPPQYSSQSYAPPPPAPATHQANYYNNYPSASAALPQPHAPYNAPNGSYEPASQAPRQGMDYSSHSDYRRPATQHTPPPPHHGGYAQQASQAYQPQTYQQPPAPQAPQHSYPSIDLYNSRPPPLEPMHPPTRTTGVTTPSHAKAFDLPPLNTAIPPGRIEASSPSSNAPQSSYYSSTQTPHDTHKRSFGNVFSDRHQNGPLRQGARPGTYYGHADSIASIPSLSAADDDDNAGGELDPSSMGMQYRRADGREIQRALPGRN